MDRKKRVLGTLTLAMTFAFAMGQTAVEGSDPDHKLRLAWFGGKLDFPVHFKTVSREVEGTFADLGIDVVWADPTAPSPRVLKIIVLPVEPSAWNLPADTMGVYLGDDGLQPAVYIFVRNVLQALSLDGRMARIPTLKERHQIARALGKVVAHEIIHALTPDCTHESEGLMRNSLGRYLLLNQRDPLESRRVESIFRGLRRLNQKPTLAEGEAVVLHAAP